MARSPRLVAWVSHFLRCRKCGRDHYYVDVGPLREPMPRAQLCDEGRRLQDAWLDEPEAPRKP